MTLRLIAFFLFDFLSKEFIILICVVIQICSHMKNKALIIIHCNLRREFPSVEYVQQKLKYQRYLPCYHRAGLRVLKLIGIVSGLYL
jgi:hypothetical protein